MTEVNEESDRDEELTDEEADSTEDELLQRFRKMTFVVANRKLERLPTWVKVSDVFKTDEDAPFLSRAGIERIDDPRYSKYSQRLAGLRAVRKYSYRMDVLERSMSYDEVTEIFVRVNSLGAKLRSSDLALAQITAKWRNSLATFQAFQQECADRGFDVDLGIHLKNMIAFATGQSRFLTVSNLTVEQLQQAWKRSKVGLEFATNFLKANVGIDSSTLLSSPFLMVTLAYFGDKRDYRLTPEESARLRYWVLAANAKGRYSRGSTETLLDQDLGALRDGAGAQALIDRLRLQMGRLDITPDELMGRNQRSAIFKTMFLAFRASGAKDWRSTLTIAIDHSGSQHQLQFHHIFPKAILKGHYSAREADDIANLSFISGKTNREISDKEPAAYLPEFLSKAGLAPFEAQAIPTDREFLTKEAYPDFLAERRRRVAERLNAFIGTDMPTPPPKETA